MSRKPRAPIPPLERIARMLCALPRIPQYWDHRDRDVVLKDIDAKAFVSALAELRLERADKSKVDEALQLKKLIDESRELFSKLLEQIPVEALDKAEAASDER